MHQPTGHIYLLNLILRPLYFMKQERLRVLYVSRVRVCVGFLKVSSFLPLSINMPIGVCVDGSL